MFASRYFAPHYFARVYFPRPALAKPRYFPHGYFAQRYFADHYFPGNLLEIVAPTPTPTVGGGPGPAPRYIPVVHVSADLVIPSPRLQGFGLVTPASVGVQASLQIPRPVDLAVQWMLSPPIRAGGTFTVPAMAFSATATSRVPRRNVRTRAQDEAEEQALLDQHYLLTLAMVRKRKS